MYYLHSQKKEGEKRKRMLLREQNALRHKSVRKKIKPPFSKHSRKQASGFYIQVSDYEGGSEKRQLFETFHKFVIMGGKWKPWARTCFSHLKVYSYPLRT